MKTFDDLRFAMNSEPILGLQAKLYFDNDFGVSVIKGHCSRGGNEGLYELAVFHNGGLHYDNPVAQGDVRGYLTSADVTALMAEIQGLDSDVAVVESAVWPVVP